MRKKLLFTVSMAVGFGLLQAQTTSPAKLAPHLDVAQPFNKVILVGDEVDVNPPQQMLKKSAANSPNGRTIGKTTYDLQTNNAVQNRLFRNSDGTMSAVWTFSNTYNVAAPDRGTGYNYFNGTSWGPSPTARIETERGGWPSIVHTGLNAEVNTLHNTTTRVITQSRRGLKGVGSWTQTNITSPTLDILWNRMVAGGPNDEYLHMIGVTAPVANQGVLYQGLDGALVYYRSPDGGLTWDIIAQVIPGTTSNEFKGFSGDSYAITARGNTIAIAVFNGWADSFILKSTDNGTTWSKQVFFDFPFTKYTPDQPGGSDVTGNGIADTLYSTDGSGSVLIDLNNKVHVTYGRMRILDADLTDGSTSYFPGTNGLAYWNEEHEAHNGFNTTFNGNVIASALDLDQNGTIGAVGIPRYFMSLSSMSNMSIDATGTMYVSYAAHMETLSNGSQNYRHVYVTKSSDGGCTWSTPVDITPTSNFHECVFPSMAPTTVDSVRIIYQEDTEPGLAVRGDEDAFGDNDIVYVAKHISTFNTPAFACLTSLTSYGNTQFCAGDSVMLEASCGNAYSWSSGESTQAIYAKNYGTYTVTITTACGQQTESIVISAPTVMTPFTLSAPMAQLCANDSTEITVSGISIGSGGSYNWSNGGSSVSTIANGPGTYIVTVTNCVGTGVDSLIIVAPTSVDNTISGPTQLCIGDTIMISAALNSGATYAWTKDSAPFSNDREIEITQTGVYEVTITNCAGTANVTANISFVPAPVATITKNGPDIFCEGNNVMILTASEGASYLWSSGQTTRTISLSQASQAGSYTVTVTNQCGVSDVSTATSVSINAQPAIPVITFNGGTYTSSYATGNQWYVNNLPIIGENGQTFTPNLIGVEGRDIFVIHTDANGCISDKSNTMINVKETLLGESTVKIYPNPAKSFINISFENQNDAQITMNVRNLIGQNILVESFGISNNTIKQIDLNSFNSGVYFITIANGTEEFTQKFIVE